ncbi:MAG: YceK/YidQ family lipoprotein [bacterium]|nr:YceK/YidQ family lipoprotein [bacterium]
MLRRIITNAYGFVLVLLLSNCSTIMTIAFVDEAGVYSGTRFNAAMVATGPGVGHPHQPIPQNCLFAGGLVDLPFSLVMDTVALPYTIPVSIYESATAENDSYADDDQVGDEDGGDGNGYNDEDPDADYYD